MDTRNAGLKAKQASIELAAVKTDVKNTALLRIAEQLDRNRAEIKRANMEDMERSERENLPKPLLKRLLFDDGKIDGVISGIMDLIKLSDPVGVTMSGTLLDDGLELYKVSCPIGVIGIIFESRPDALVQISTLCLKSGNAVLLKGGSEARETNKVLAGIIKNSSEEAGIPEGWIHLLETRADVNEMLKMDDLIDLIIPRGSNEFVRYIMNNSNIPVLGHADGICHCYVDAEADINMALSVVIDSKTQYVAVCNAAETLLVHKDIAREFLPLFKKKMDERNVQLYGCERTRAIIDTDVAGEDAWSREYLDYKMSVKVVDSLEEAVNHINTYGSGHTDCIITRNKANAMYFMDYVDSGNVYWNASTRFYDGYRYGFGAEVGISTNKIHVRGPVGLEGLVIYKYKLIGNGHIVDDYARNKKTFKHKKLFKDLD